MNRPRIPWNTFLVATLCVVLAGCTLVRESDNGSEEPTPVPTNSESNAGGIFFPNGGQNAGLPPIPEGAPELDALLMVDLSRGSANIMQAYYTFLALVEFDLRERGIAFRSAAFAPMYRQQSGAPLLLYGQGDPDNLSHDPGHVLEYYVSDQGLAHLDGRVDAPGENLAALGLSLAYETVFNPEYSSEEGRAYYREAGDGFVVFHLTSTARDCGHGHGECTLDGSAPAEYFTRTDEETGHASWLNLPGSTGLAPDEIAHISISTAEGVDYDDFVSHCSELPNFPMSYIDFIEPSDNEYYTAKMEQLSSLGGIGHTVDLCTAFSARAESTARQVAGEIARIAH